MFAGQDAGLLAVEGAGAGGRFQEIGEGMEFVSLGIRSSWLFQSLVGCLSEILDYALLKW